MTNVLDERRKLLRAVADGLADLPSVPKGGSALTAPTRKWSLFHTTVARSSLQLHPQPMNFDFKGLEVTTQSFRRLRLESEEEEMRFLERNANAVA